MPRRKKYEDRDPAWTGNHESRYQRGLLFGKKMGRPCPRLDVVAIAELTQEPLYEMPFDLIHLKGCVDHALETLSPREEKVVRYLFGIGVEDSHTLAETGVVFSVGAERIRQIYARAIRKLRHPARSKYLRAFTENP